MSALIRMRKEKALRAKLGLASFALHSIRESEVPELNRHRQPQRYVIEFLQAAASVYPTAEAFSDGIPQGFQDWVSDWERRSLSASEHSLWQQLHSECVLQERGELVGLISVSIPIPNRDLPEIHQYPLSPKANETQAHRSKVGVRFRAYPQLLASEVCEEYFELSKRFVEDYLADHGNFSGQRI